MARTRIRKGVRINPDLILHRLNKLSDEAFRAFVEGLHVAGRSPVQGGGFISYDPALAKVGEELMAAGHWIPIRGGWLVPDEPRSYRWGLGDDRVAIPPRVRQQIYKRDGHACVLCGAPDDLTIDHIFPWSLGGTNDPDNLQTMCRSHNSSKGARA